MVYFSESQTLIKINFYVVRNASCNRVGGPVYLCVAPTSSTRAASFLQIRRPPVSHFPTASPVAPSPETAPVNSLTPANGNLVRWLKGAASNQLAQTDQINS